ncbi:sensor histidine kinase [Formosa sp. PL04]|uniref:sensor histidine kinase n=1 Tax=Formosa sp. PL04 TaxID=3081755 RepID=UPI00298103FA|nr:histidine kinase [Formosa sp. PL04]MDW5289867.1 histidine kinase [Formosa sp. PL04]
MVQTGQTLVSTSAERYLLVYMIGVLLIVCTLIIVFFVVFQKRKNKLLLDKIIQQQIFEEEISKTQIEIQEQTLKNIGQDLHDNVGQLLSVANMQLSMLAKQVGPELQSSFSESKDLVKESLQELRSLSKSLNSDVIAYRGFQESVNTDIERFNKLEIINAELIVEGDSNHFKKGKDSIILFRIFQEFFSNTIKYSEASHLKVHINYTPDFVIINASDDGVGFDKNEINKGSGLINMKSRAELIHADFKMTSKKKEGVNLKIKYSYRSN